jgi:hypothetical protein
MGEGGGKEDWEETKRRRNGIGSEGRGVKDKEGEDGREEGH